MPVLADIRTLVTPTDDAPQGDLRTVEGAALAWEGETIRWVGPAAELPAAYADDEQHRAHGALVVPGLIDAHTHLAFGGWRADEFELRSRGATYQAIAEAGGGILSTMRQTRAASEDALVAKSLDFLHRMARLGVTTVEAKSGYGLSVEDELKLLRVYRRLQALQPLTLVPTFLGAHVLPPEYREDRAGYLRLLTDELLPRIAEEKLAAFCDVFVEEGAFTAEEARTLLTAARRHGLGAKLHVDQLGDGGGGRLAADVRAVSADHLEYTSDDGIRAMAEAGVVAVTLPLASLYLRQPPLDARRFLEAGVPVAVATDFNPGSAPSYHLPFALTLACTMNRLTPAQALDGATRIAARAIGQAGRLGTLAPGKRADFVLLDAPSVNHWLYHLRPNAAVETYVAGRPISEAFPAPASPSIPSAPDS